MTPTQTLNRDQRLGTLRDDRERVPQQQGHRQHEAPITTQPVPPEVEPPSNTTFT